MFSFEFCKICENSFLKNTSIWLVLYIIDWSQQMSQADELFHVVAENSFLRSENKIYEDH